jgi:hypothetical protein
MGETKPRLAHRTGDFGEAFPNVEAIDFSIDDNPWGWYDVRGHRPLQFTSASATSFIPCPNNRCRRGGFDFGTFLRNYTYGSKITSVDQSYPCNGDEGTPAGRRKGDPCMNSFKVKGTITYKAGVE